MSQDNMDILWLIFGYIGTNWGTESFCTMPQSQFQQVISWQIQLDINYQCYYLQAIAEYVSLFEQYGTSQAALQKLFTENQLPAPKIPVVANFVLLEFMRWNVAFGGFLAFNYENYNGWMGGGSFLSQPPPYRALPITSSGGATVPDPELRGFNG